MNAAVTVLAAAGNQLPEDVGKSGPMGLLLTVVLFLASVLLVKSMGRHLERVPRSFDAEEQPQVVVPDTPADLVGPRPGEQVLDRLRRAPLAIEPPRSDDRGGTGSR